MRMIPLLFLLLCSAALADPGHMVTGNILTNPGANTTLVTTGNLASRGTISATYKVNFVLTGTVAMVFRIELLNASDVVQQTLYVSVPANDTKIINLGAEFNIPNDWEIRVLNQTGVILGGQLQASIITQPVDVN